MNALPVTRRAAIARFGGGLGTLGLRASVRASVRLYRYARSALGAKVAPTG